MGCWVLQFECLSIKILVIDTGRKQGGGREKEGERKQFFFKYYSYDGAQDIFRIQVGLISINIIPFPVFFININILALGMPPGSFIPAVFCIGFRGKSRKALNIYIYRYKNWAYLLYSFWIAICAIPEWRSRFDYQIQLRPGFVHVEHHVSAYCKYLYRRQEHHNHVHYTICLAAGEDLQWFSLVQSAAARNPSQCCNNYCRDHILFR